jgi:hypothetical protein
MNIPLLRKVQEQILKQPLNYNQDYFESDVVGCDSTHCIGGWAAVLSGHQGYFNSGSMENFAAEKLELTPKQAEILFYGQNNIEDKFNGIWTKQDNDGARLTPLEIAQLACERIDHFIKTEGRE